MSTDNSYLTDLIESQGGVHISIYIPYPSSSINLKSFLEAALLKCSSQIGNNLNQKSFEELVGPIRSLAADPKLLESFTSNIAIFRTFKGLRVISLPVHLDFAVHVANSFHVKPLLSYLNQSYKYLFFGSDGVLGFLYEGNKKRTKLVEDFNFKKDNFLISERVYRELKTKKDKEKFLFQMNISWIKQAIDKVDPENSRLIFIAAPTKVFKSLKKTLNNRNIFHKIISNTYKAEDQESIISFIHSQMILESASLKSNIVNGFQQKNLNPHLLCFDINKLSKAAIKGQVKKLLIASDVYVFGNIQEETGEVRLNDRDCDHTDDDLLDDVAQNVFKTGGEVFVIPKKYMPNGHVIIGILSEGEYF